MMYLDRDSHVHTNFSQDANPNASFQAYIDEAQRKGITQITFTDHIDFDAAHPLFQTPINYDEYIASFNEVKQHTTFDMKLGVEIGYQSHTKDRINQFLTQYPFEFVILSVHYVEKKDLYTKEYFQGKTKKEAYDTYFKLCLEAINNTPNFTVFGHLDYISRYSPFGDYEYQDYKEIIDEILQALINRNKGIEINTSGLKHEGRTYPCTQVINRYKELGGTILSYGSDAHNITELGVKQLDI